MDNKKDAVARIEDFQRFGSVLGLGRISALCEMMGSPEKTLKVIHVAGTNGKGSVSRYIYEALRANGYKVGLFISPFIEVFNERIEFDGELISDEDLTRHTDRVLALVDELRSRGAETPTEFEVITAVMFSYFAEKKPDFAVLEVGLGGRGDSTNVIEKPLASVITSISYDHMDRLGNTLAEIAAEKAGIIKAGSPVVVNVPHGKDDPEDVREAARVIAKKAYELGSELYDVTKLKYGNCVRDEHGSRFDTFIEGTDYAGVEISMAGDHQIQNALTALYTLEILRKKREIKVERGRLYAGLKAAFQPGRFEIFDEYDPPVILDGAHNEAGAAALEATMSGRYERPLMVVGILADKDREAILGHFCGIADDFIATEPDSPRRLSAEELCGILKARGKNCVAEPDIEKAVSLALETAGRKESGDGSGYGAVLFAGSLYLIGRVRTMVKR